MNIKKYVSIHGGHSGQFCKHAVDDLREIVLTYINKGFKWVGITEHMPPVSDQFIYDDERAAGLTIDFLMKQFDTYMNTLLILQEEFAEQIIIYTSFETEYYTGAIDFIKNLKNKYNPDYVLGSIHHVKDMNFDYSSYHYENAITACKGLNNMYLNYFEEQYELLYNIKPKVVGHFDLIRLFDNDYKSRIKNRDIMKKIERNLIFIKDNNMVIDFNLRAIKKGADEPYVSYYILMMAKEMGIRVLPGDDSHGIKDVGNYMDKAEEILHNYGFETEWKSPFSK